MPVFIGLLRGVNVGGNHKLKMAELKALCESAGLTDVSTYLQSGNVVFRTRAARAAAAERVKTALRERTGLDVAVVLRTPAELRAVIDANPITGDPNPSRLLVAFLSEEPTAEAKALLERERVADEQLHFAGREIYSYYPEGAGTSRLANAMTDRKLKVTCTARNW
ncbi:MAG: hypothetical protein QOH21_882, partial [Acidobacteriota bacterium]|nr:hypothetical protein [Acidobacteriota bacterium]